MTHLFPATLSTLITYLRRLSGVGSRTAERFAFEMLSWPQEQIQAFSALLGEIQEDVSPCKICGCLTQKQTCPFCAPSRDTNSLCILASPKDAYAIEETRSYKGLYHVIEHLLSPLHDRHSHTLRVDRIEERIRAHGIKEVILALDSTLEGDATALYLKAKLEAHSISISRLAFGIPMGSSLDYIDGGTLARALQGRQRI